MKRSYSAEELPGQKRSRLTPPPHDSSQFCELLAFRPTNYPPSHPPVGFSRNYRLPVSSGMTLPKLQELVVNQVSDQQHQWEPYKIDGLRRVDSLDPKIVSQSLKNGRIDVKALTDSILTVGDVFADQLNNANDDVHIVILPKVWTSKSLVPQGTWNAFMEKLRQPNRIIPEPNPLYIQRAQVRLLYNLLLERRIVQLKGPPSSGKSTFLDQLGDFICNNDPEAILVRVQGGWDGEKSLEEIFEKHFASPQVHAEPLADLLKNRFLGKMGGENIFILHDEIQSTYKHSEFWRHTYDNLRARSNLYLACCSCYGSDSSYADHSELGPQTADNSPRRHSVLLEGPQQVILNQNPRLIQPYHTLQLALTREEYDSYRALQPKIADNLSDRFWDVSNGHIGAIAALYDFVRQYSSHQFRKLIDDTINTGDRMSSKLAPFDLKLLRRVLGYSTSGMTKYTKEVGLADVLTLTPEPGAPGHNLFVRHLTQPSSFTKGIPIPHQNHHPDRTNYMTLLAFHKELYYETEKIPDIVKDCVRLGYAILDRVPYRGDLNIRVAKFASPLHRYVVAATHLEKMSIRNAVLETSILDFVLRVLSNFEQQELLKFVVMHLLECHYQMEFYRVANQIYKRAVMLTPEFFVMEDQHRIDFYVADKKWGIELLRDGKRGQEHIEAFDEDGKYHHFMKEGYITEYLLLDCRKNNSYSRRNIKHLYHAVFEDNYKSVSVYDDFGNCKLTPHLLTNRNEPPLHLETDPALLGVKAKDLETEGHS
ncbi:hypothetical protein VKT23_015512 [Stygiomarasmius scandens]|uniref:AAA+ ATPase domain-containing protein n=1 Tax=Marasmiellus scandens TaxID=2682957 RepID=A0ABR1IXC3_9AGAR